MNPVLYRKKICQELERLAQFLEKSASRIENLGLEEDEEAA